MTRDDSVWGAVLRHAAFLGKMAAAGLAGYLAMLGLLWWYSFSGSGALRVEPGRGAPRVGQRAGHDGALEHKLHGRTHGIAR